MGITTDFAKELLLVLKYDSSPNEGSIIILFLVFFIFKTMWYSFTFISSFNPHNTLWDKFYQYSHFIDKKLKFREIKELMESPKTQYKN